MALSANTVWEIRNGGSDTNGGGFVTGSGGTDYSLQDAAQLSVADAACTGNTTVTSATGGFTAAMIGSIMYLSSGPGWYQITARTDTNTITIDRNGPNASGMTANVGGAMASPGAVSGLRVLGNTVFVKYHATAYEIASTSPNVATGIINQTSDGSDSVVDYWIGYDTTRTVVNNDANRPKFQVAAAGVSSVTVFRVAPGSTLCNTVVRNIIIDGQSKTGIRGFDFSATAGGGGFDRCEANNCTNSGFVLSSGFAVVSFGRASGCSTAAAYKAEAAGGLLIACVGNDNTITAFSMTGNGCIAVGCIADSNTGGSSDGFNQAGGTVAARLIYCESYGNGRDGFRFDSGNPRGSMVVSCVGWGNTGNDFTNGSGPLLALYCAGETTSGITQNIGFVTLTADPFVDSANGDFNLNATAGGGVDPRALSVAMGGTDLYPFRNWVSDAFGGGGGGLVNPIISAGGGLVIRGQ